MELDPISYSKTCSIKELTDFIKKCDYEYYHGNKIILSDSIYDSLKDLLEERDPNNILFKQIGASENNDKKIKMPYYMGSMDKVKTTEGITKFVNKFIEKKNEFVISDKLDGTSALLIIKNNTIVLYKRGDREYGRDISYLFKYLNINSLSSNNYDEIVIRGELIISKENYEKYKDKFASARHMVNGLVNTKEESQNDMSNVLDFVCFEIMKPSLEPNQQFKLLEELKLKNAHNILVDSNKIMNNIHNIPNSFLVNYLKERKEKGLYEIDGIIISHNSNYELIESGNPKHSIAFKANSLGKITKVKNVEWNISKHGLLIPRLQFDKIELGGNIVEHATGFNAKFIIDNKIGLDTIIRVVLSGDIIPYITEIIQQTDPKMPDLEYEFTTSGIDIKPISLEDNINHKIKQFTHFFKTLKIENISDGILKKLIENKYDTLNKILNMTIEDFLSIDGFKNILSKKIYTNIHNVVDNPINSEILMVASLCFGFGFGIRRMKSITNKYKNILDIDIKKEDIMEIEGFSDITAKKFIDSLPSFKEFMTQHPILKIKKIKLIKVKRVKKDNVNDQPKKFENKVFVMSGFRDKDIINEIEKNGGTLGDSINKKTNYLLVKSKEKITSKISKAKELNIEILTKEEFELL